MSVGLGTVLVKNAIPVGLDQVPIRIRTNYWSPHFSPTESVGSNTHNYFTIFRLPFFDGDPHALCHSMDIALVILEDVKIVTAKSNVDVGISRRLNSGGLK